MFRRATGDIVAHFSCARLRVAHLRSIGAQNVLLLVAG